MIALDTRERRWFALTRADEGRADAPAFETRFLSCRRLNRVERLIAEASKKGQAKDQEGEEAALTEALKLGLTNWRRIRTDAPEIAAAFGVAGPAGGGLLVELPFKPELAAEAL